MSVSFYCVCVCIYWGHTYLHRVGISGIGAIFDASVISFFCLFEMKRGYYADNRGQGKRGVTYIFCFGYVLYVRQCLCVSSLSQFCLVFFFFDGVVDLESLDILALYNNACAVVRHLFARASLPRAQIDRATPLGQSVRTRDAHWAQKKLKTSYRSTGNKFLLLLLLLCDQQVVVVRNRKKWKNRRRENYF